MWLDSTQTHKRVYEVRGPKTSPNTTAISNLPKLPFHK